jgi:hypothetical protein
MKRDNAPKKFQIYPWSKEIDEEVKNTLRRMKTSNSEEKSEFLILGELNPPKDRRIPRRNQEITNGETWGTLTVALEKWRVKKSEEVSSVRGGLKRENRTV